MSENLQKIKLAKLIVYAVIILLVIIGSYILLVVVPNNAVRESSNIASKISNKLGQVFNSTPKVTVNAEYISIETIGIAEFATLERTVVANYTYTHQWLKSKKTITLSGRYKVKGGFDLRKGFLVEILLDKEPLEVTAKLPDPQILSVEQESIEVAENDGYWNKVNDNDRNFALNNLKHNAIEQIMKSNFLDEVRLSSQKRVTDVVLNQLDSHKLESTVKE